MDEIMRLIDEAFDRMYEIRAQVSTGAINDAVGRVENNLIDLRETALDHTNEIKDL